jgi:hypothetical protein
MTPSDAVGPRIGAAVIDLALYAIGCARIRSST